MRFNTIGRATAMNFLWGWDRNEFAKMGSPPDRISLASGTPSSYRGVMASQRRSKKCGGGGRWIDRSSGKKAKKEKQKKKQKKKKRRRRATCLRDPIKIWSESERELAPSFALQVEHAFLDALPFVGEFSATEYTMQTVVRSLKKITTNSTRGVAIHSGVLP